MAKTAHKNNETTAPIGFVAKLWAVNALRNNMDETEYKYIVLGTQAGVNKFESSSAGIKR
jgi:hypothetical protein